MNLIDAIKSGKRFKRREWSEYIELKYGIDTYIAYSAESIIAEDWEVEEKKIEITESQLLEAWQKAIMINEFNANYERFETLKRELGL